MANVQKKERPTLKCLCNQTRFLMLTKCLNVFHKTAPAKYNLLTCFFFYFHIAYVFHSNTHYLLKLYHNGT